LTAWRVRCANADAGRLRAAVADAFIDGTPIDWTALLTRADDTDRVFFEDLRLLDRIRRQTAPHQAAAGSNRSTFVLARLVLAAGAIQTFCGLGAITIAFVRGNEVVYRTPQIALALSFAAACLCLGVAASRDQRCVFLLATFAASASAFTRAAVVGLPPSSAGLVPLFHGLVTEAFAPASLWQFAVAFPDVRRFTLFDLIARRAAGVAWAVGSVLFGVNFAVAHRLLGDSGWMLERNHPSKVFWHLFAIVMLPAVAAILVRSRRASPVERRKVARLALAIGAGTVPFLVCAVLRMMLPGLNRWFLSATSTQHFWVEGAILGSLATLPILSAIAVVVDRPFEPQPLALRSIGHRLVREAAVMVVIAPIVALAAALYGRRHMDIADVGSRADAWLLLGYAAALCLLAGRGQLGAILDVAGLRPATDHPDWLTGALERVRAARGTREISVELGRALRDGVGALTVRILVPQNDADPRGGTFVDPYLDVTPLYASTGLLAVLERTARPLDLAPDSLLRRLMPRDGRDWLAANDVALAAPLKRRDGSIAAMVMCGPRRGGRAFDRGDCGLITALIAGAAAAWDVEDSRHGGDSTRVGAADAEEAAFECPQCGALSESKPLPCGCSRGVALASIPGRLAGKFVAERRLGAGGMGVVYVARDITLDRQVALKTLPRLDGAAVERLRDEARAMAALNHESLATIYGLELWRGTPVLVVEYFPEGTLARRLTSGSLTASAALSLGIRLARALTYMHARRVIHHDLKPGNIALTATGAPKLLDFGLATLSQPSRLSDPEPTSGPMLRAVAGTPAYLPPEAFLGAPPGPEMDLWALSVILVEALTGHNPFSREGEPADRAVHHALARASWLAPRDAAMLTHLFERALASDREQRFPTSADLQTALESVAARLERG
jgi:hypothetical protein